MQVRFQKLDFNEPIAVIIDKPGQKKLIGKEAQGKRNSLKETLKAQRQTSVRITEAEANTFEQKVLKIEKDTLI